MENHNPTTEFCTKKYVGRCGTADEGRNYENLVQASLALNLVIDEEVVDFDIKSNVDGYGAFDDVVLEVEKTGSKKQYCMQLKYKESPKKSLPKDALNADRGDFSLQKYCTDYNSIVLKKKVHFTGILLAKVQFKWDANEVLSNDVCKYRIEKADDLDDSTKLCKSLDKNSVCYRFVITNDDDSCESEEVEKYKLFFNNFILCITSASTSDIEKNISRIYKLNFFQQSAFVNFIELIKNVTKQHYSLRKQLINYVITLSILDLHMYSLTFEKDFTEEEKVLIEIALENTVTHVSNINHCIDFGKESKNKITEKDVKKLSTVFKFGLDHVDKMYTKALWLQGKCPMVVKNSPAVRAAIELSADLKYIIIDKNPTDIKNLVNLKTLADIKHYNDSLYQKIANTFECRLQHKVVHLKSLLDLDQRVSEVISINTLYQIVCEKVNIGNVTLELPETHITPRHFKINNTNNSKTTNSLSDEEVTNDDFNDPKLQRAHKNSIFYKMLNSYSNSNSSNSIRNLITDPELTRDEHKNCIIFGGPGMGKSTIAKHLVYTSRPNRWCIFLNAQDLSKFLSRKKDSLKDFRKYLLKKQKQNGSAFEYQMFKIFFDNNAIRFFWDAVDEIDKNNFESIKSLIMQLQSDKTTHYITSRPHLESDLKKAFDKIDNLSLTLIEFDKAEQQHYIQNKLNLTEESMKLTFSQIETNITTIKQNNIFGIPLQIYMITELFQQMGVTGGNIHVQDFTLDRLYDHFVREKLKVYFVEKLKLDLTLLGHRKLLDEQVLKCTTLFKKLAAGLYFCKESLKDLDVKCDFAMLQDIKNNGDPTGFIVKLNNLSHHFCNVQFFHNSMAEFFAAQFLFESLKKIKNYCRYFENYHCKNVQFFFDLMLAKGSNAHIAALYKNSELFDKCSEEEVNKNDKGGRNVLQALIVYNRDIDKIPYRDEADTLVLSTSSHFMRYPFKTQETLFIVDKLKYLTRKNDIFAKDSIAALNTLDYLEKTQFFLAIGIIYSEIVIGQSRKYKKLTKLFKTYKNDIIVACLLHDYSKLLDVVKKLPNIRTDLPEEILDFEETLLFYKCSNWIKKLILEKSLNCISNFNLFQLIDWNLICDNLTCFNLSVNDTLAKDVSDIIQLLIALDKFFFKSKNSRNIKKLFLRVCQLGLPETVNLLLRNGVDIEMTDNENKTCLHYACECSSEYFISDCDNNHYLIVKTLLDRGAFVNASTIRKSTPLHTMCLKKNNLDLFKLLLENNADIAASNNSGSTVLHFACGNKYTTVETIEAMLQNELLVNCKDNKNDTALHYATFNCSAEIVNCLVKKNANVNAVNKDGETPLHAACLAECENVAKMQLLLENNADIDTVDNTGSTVLHFACSYEHTTVETIEFILNKGISVNCPDKNNNTPLHNAASDCRIEIVNCLIQKHANVNATNKLGATPLHKACSSYFDNIQKMQALLDNNADICATDDAGATLLHLVCNTVNVTVPTIKFILQKALDVNWQDKNYDTPLHYAAFNCKAEIVNCLIRKGANVNAVNRDRETPLHAASLSKCDSIEKMQLILKNNGDINAVDKSGFTVLHFACTEEHTTVETINFILKSGLSINCQDVNNDTALHNAAARSTGKIVDFLIRKSASINATNKDGTTPLHKACSSYFDNIEKMQLLLNNNADINAIDSTGCTVLHLACNNWNTTVQTIQFILQNNASVNCQNVNNDTALHYAAYNCKTEIVDFLIRNDANVNIINRDELLPIHAACSSECENIQKMQVLLNSADTNSFDTWGPSILHYVCRTQEPTSVETIKFILNKGVSVNCQDKKYDTPLHYAAFHCKTEIVDCLIQNGAKVNIANKNGRTPLHAACLTSYENFPIIQLLLDKNAYCNAVDETGFTALHYACTNKDVTVQTIKLIAQNSASVNCKDQNNDTALHLAAFNCTAEIVNCLIQNGASVNSVNKDGATPLNEARSSHFESAQKVQLLIESNGAVGASLTE